MINKGKMIRGSLAPSKKCILVSGKEVISAIDNTEEETDPKLLKREINN